MNWSDVGGFLGEVAPAVGRALKESAGAAAPVLGSVAGNAIAPGVGGLVGAELGRRVSEALGVEPTPQAVANAVKADPEGASIKLRKMDIELAGMYLADQQNARDMQIAVLGSQNAGWLAKNFVYLMAAVVIIAVFGYIGAITFIELSPTGERYADIAVTGIAGGLIGSVTGFFLGGRQRQLDNPVPRSFMDAVKTR